MTSSLIAANNPPRGGLIFGSFPHKGPEEEDLPRRISTMCFEGVLLPPGSLLGQIEDPSMGGEIEDPRRKIE